VVVVALTTLAVVTAGVQSFERAPRPRAQARDIGWLSRYEVLREPLEHTRTAIYLNAPGVRGKFRYFRAQYVLTPTTLILRARPERFLDGSFPDRPVIVDYQTREELDPVVDAFRRQADGLGIDVEIREYGSLALIRRPHP
jgi:hypothetical protein